MNPILLQSATGPYEALLDLSEAHHRACATRSGFDYLPNTVHLAGGRHPSWNKIVMIREALARGHDGFLWIDADAVIARDVDLSESFPLTGVGMAWYFDPSNSHWHWNAGVLSARNTPEIRRFFDAVWDAPEHDHGWWEQYTMHRLFEDPQWSRIPENIGLRWNCGWQAENEVAYPSVRHWPGYGATERLMELIKKGIEDFALER